MDSLFGEGGHTDGATYGGAKRSRVCRMSPALPSELRAARPIRHIDNWNAVIDNWAWYSVHATTLSPPWAVIPFWPTLLLKAKDTSDWSIFDTTEGRRLHNHRVQNQSTGLTKYVGVTHGMHWLGLHRTPIPSLKTLWPCQGEVDPGTGMPPIDAQHSLTTPCGETRLCHTCNVLYSLISRSWHFSANSDFMGRFLLNWALTQTDPRTPGVAGPPGIHHEFSAATRECDEHCPHRHRLHNHMQGPAIDLTE